MADKREACDQFIWNPRTGEIVEECTLEKNHKCDHDFVIIQPRPRPFVPSLRHLELDILANESDEQLEDRAQRLGLDIKGDRVRLIDELVAFYREDSATVPTQCWNCLEEDPTQLQWHVNHRRHTSKLAFLSCETCSETLYWLSEEQVEDRLNGK